MSGVYKTIKEITGKRKYQQASVKDKDGNTITDKANVLSRVKEYTEDLYRKASMEPSMSRLLSDDSMEEEPEPLLEEV